MEKFYRVKKDTFLWKAGAIIKYQNPNAFGGSPAGYTPIEDIWDATPVNLTEYISARIIEHPDNADFFERVYPDTITGKLFKTKDQIVELYKTTFTN